MSLFRSLVKNLRQQAIGRRTFTPAEVRELIELKLLAEALAALEHLSASLYLRDAVRQSLLGEVRFQQRDDDGAARAFREALQLAPGLPSAHYGLSLLFAESGALDDALRHAFFANSVEPNDARFLAQVGYCQLKLCNYALAERPLRRTTLLAPRHAHAWNNLGVVLLMKGRLEEAHDCFQQALKVWPSFQAASDNLERLRADLREALGHEPDLPQHRKAQTGEHTDAPSNPHLVRIRALERDGSLQAAIDACENLLVSAPDEVTVVLEAHRLYQRVGDPASGIDVLQAHRTRHMDDDAVAAALGFARLDMREFKRAEGLLQQAVAARPEDLERVLGLAESLAGQERYEDAGKWLDEALRLAPDLLRVRAARASNLINQCRYDEGLTECLSLEAKGMHVPSLGMVLGYLGRFDEAQSALERSAIEQPNEPQIRYHLAGVRLIQLDFERGWEDYAYRAFGDSEHFRVLPFALWKGESLTGKRVLVLAEQGLGDQVMFASCLPDLLTLGPSEVVVEVIDRIAPTLRRSFPTCRIIATDQGRRLDWLKDCPNTDFYVPLGDLPRHFRRSLASFPEHSGYLIPAPERIAHWRARLTEAGPGPYIGFSWKGGVESTRTSLRSIEAKAFTSLAAACPGTWICLQYGKVEEQLESARQSGFEVAFWPEAISDLDEFAALIAALDLVVTVCNTTVHYAGAIGRPVWVLAPKVPEWRYGVNNRALPWYPRSRMFRQHRAGDWSGAIDDVRHELTLWVFERDKAA